ncbi:MAG: hypothetical protein K0R15_2677 [Clostridiales bacterium]|jgi:molybdate transport system substrate-binding protein|nr:hypothetical protein [Clostridiales bacterium]
MRRRYIKSFLLIFTVLFLLSGCNKVKENEKTASILIACAASLQNVMEELQTIYKAQQPDISITFTFGSSGSLQQQIQQGAPIDVFISAAQKNMNVLLDEDLILESTKIDLLENKVVLIVPKESKLGISSFEDITKATIIALGDPETVPAGQYAEEIFTSLNILDDIESKVTYAKDVTEVLTWISTGNVDAGVVYATDAMISKDVEVVAEAPKGSCSKVIYPVAITKETNEIEAASIFVDFLMTKEARAIFEQYGFSTQE